MFVVLERDFALAADVIFLVSHRHTPFTRSRDFCLLALPVDFICVWFDGGEVTGGVVVTTYLHTFDHPRFQPMCHGTRKSHLWECDDFTLAIYNYICKQ